MASELIQSTVQENTVYVDRWTNWSHGPIMGATLTLTHRDGGFLIAFITLFVTVTGARFWNIVSFITHIMLSREALQDAIYHQRQAILCNTNSSASGLWKLLRMSWAWRRYDRAPLFKRIFPTLLLSFVTLTAFAVTGIFSSRVATSMGGEVLISSPNCGTFNPGTNIASPNSGNAYIVRRMQYSSNYALLCYGNNSFMEDCPTYLRQSLPFNITRNNPCPFPGKGSICRNSSDTIRLDSGFVNSHFNLGISAPPDMRFLYRSVTECTPLLTEGFSQPVDLAEGTNSSVTVPLLDFLYGKTIHHNNATYQYYANSPLMTPNGSGNYGIFDYVLNSQVHYGEPPGTTVDSQWNPISQLTIPDGDVNILFLSANDIKFLNRVNDPWYSARAFKGHVSAFELTGDKLDGNLPYWFRDDPVRTLGCIERYQFCNPNLPANSSCTSLGGIFQVSQEASDLFKQQEQRTSFSWSASAITIMAAGIAEVTDSLGVTALQSRNGLHVGFQATLADNQWELEAESWFKLTMADLQSSILEQATGPTDPAMYQFLVRPNTAEQQKVCANQKIRSQSFTSVNLFGLIIIFAFGGLIIVTSFVLPMAVECVERHWNRKAYRSLEWIANDMLQLQRLAHKAIGSGTWQETCSDCPTTAPHELLAALDLTHPRHPKLKAAEKDAVIEQVEEV